MKQKGIEKLFTLAYTDIMTGVNNRNAYEERLEKLRKKPDMLDNIMAVVVGLNKLKEINDGYGHHSGDEAIKIVARFLVKVFGAKTDIYRIGGDEFVCLSYSDIHSGISSFRDLISFENVLLPYELSVSVGYARYNNSVFNIDDLIKKCDKLMYADKRKSVQ